MAVAPPSSSYDVCPPGADTPATCEVPQFSPVRVRGARYLLGRLARRRRRALALGLAVTAAALVAAGSSQDPGRDSTAERARGRPGAASAPAAAPSRAAAPPGKPVVVETVSAPVRIADAETVRLLRPGDRVDVVASGETGAGGVRVVARGALVSKVPEPRGASADGGALVVLAVPRGAAERLAGAGVSERLAVTLW